MKVKEICGYWKRLSPATARYVAFYYAKIEDGYVILERNVDQNSTWKGHIPKYRLRDCINCIYFYNDEKELEEDIQSIIQYKDQNEPDVSECFKDKVFSPLEMQNGREIDLNLANIEVSKNSVNDQASYEYVIEKKREELLLDRLGQLQQTIKNSPERYSVERYIEIYEQQSGTKLSKQQKSRLKELDDKIQNGIIIGRYNLEDYSNFLNSIPDLLSGKKILGFGFFSAYDGRFLVGGEICKTPSVEEVASYNTYHYHTYRYDKFTMDDFQVIPSPSIKMRMNQNGLLPTKKLCAINIRQRSEGFIYDYKYGILFVEPFGRKKEHLLASVYELDADDISAYLKTTSREGLVTDVQAQLIGLADKEPNERNEEQL